MVKVWDKINVLCYWWKLKDINWQNGIFPIIWPKIRKNVMMKHSLNLPSLTWNFLQSWNVLPGSYIKLVVFLTQSKCFVTEEMNINNYTTWYFELNILNNLCFQTSQQGSIEALAITDPFLICLNFKNWPFFLWIKILFAKYERYLSLMSSS